MLILFDKEKKQQEKEERKELILQL